MPEAVQTTPQFSARILPPEEWTVKLSGTALAGHRLDPHHAIIVVVEDTAGAVIACWAAVETVHVEGLWIRADHRGLAVVARELFGGMIGELRELGVPEVMTNADSPDVEKLLRHVKAEQLPGTSWVWRLR